MTFLHKPFIIIGLALSGGVAAMTYHRIREQDPVDLVLYTVKMAVADIVGTDSEQTVDNTETTAAVQKKIFLMYTVDQYVRNELLPYRTDGRVKEYIHMIDAQHTTCIKNLIDIHGWFVKSVFGYDTGHYAWLLVQHADQEPLFQEKVLTLLESLLHSKEVDPIDYAYLYDRVALHSSRYQGKQKYGTQVDVDNDRVALKPYEGTLEKMNQRRINIGLAPIEDYLKQIQAVYGLA